MEQQHRQNTFIDVAGIEGETGSCEIDVQDFGSNPRGDIKIVGKIPSLAEEVIEGFVESDGEI